MSCSHGSKSEGSSLRKTIAGFALLRVTLVSLAMVFCLGSAAIAGSNGTATLEDPADYDLSDAFKELKDNFQYLIKVQLSNTVVEPGNSNQNPENSFLEIPHYTQAIEFRPDFSTDIKQLHLVVKPRLTVQWQHWTEGDLDGENDVDVDVFVNEWLASLNIRDGLYVSYGRENLQWGPSYFLSPSNPFFQDNGQSNPEKEVAGMDFAKLIWLPSPHWTVSLIANIDKGEQDFVVGNFERTYAVKVDYTGYRKYFSLIGSYRENDRAQWGFFGGLTVNDAIMVYAEGSIKQGTDTLYPVRILDTPFGPLIRMENVRDDDTALEGLFLAGSSYTLELGPTFTLEYVFNSEGYDDEEAKLFYELQQQAARIFVSPFDQLRDLSRFMLSRTLDNGLRLLRKNYLMLQFQHARIDNRMDLVLRYVYNLDDHSSRFNPIIEYDLGDHFQVFLVGSQNFGSQDSESRWLFDYAWMVGVNYTY